MGPEMWIATFYFWTSVHSAIALPHTSKPELAVLVEGAAKCIEMAALKIATVHREYPGVIAGASCEVYRPVVLLPFELERAGESQVRVRW